MGERGPGPRWSGGQEERAKPFCAQPGRAAGPRRSQGWSDESANTGWQPADRGAPEGSRWGGGARLTRPPPPPRGWPPPNSRRTWSWSLVGCGPWAVPARPLGLRWKRPTFGPHGQPEAPAGRSCSPWGRDRWVKGLRSAPMCPPRVLPAQPAAIRPLRRAGLAVRHTPPNPHQGLLQGPSTRERHSQQDEEPGVGVGEC